MMHTRVMYILSNMDGGPSLNCSGDQITTTDLLKRGNLA